MNKMIAILIMALLTYIIRATPMLLITKKITNPLVQSFLHYIPYCILTAMIIPDIFTSTHSIESALAGFCVAVFLAFMEKSLITVSLAAVCTAYLVELLL